MLIIIECLSSLRFYFNHSETSIENLKKIEIATLFFEIAMKT